MSESTSKIRPGELPPSYEEVLYWKVTQKIWRVVVMNLLAFPLALFFGAGFLVIVLLFGKPFEIRSAGFVWDVASFIGAAILVVPLHELAHGISMMAYGAKPKYGVMWLGLMFYATAPGYAFQRNQYLIISLAPLVSMTVLACIGILLFTGTTMVWALALFGLLNGGGAMGDLWITSLVLRYPSHAYVVDERDGIRMFLPGENLDMPAV